MKRKHILRLAMTVPVAAAATLGLFSQSGNAESLLEVTPGPNIGESVIPGKQARIVRSDGFFYEDFESMTDGVLTDGWTTIATPGLPEGKWGVGSLGTDGTAMAGTSGYTYAYILGNRDKESNLPHDAWLFSHEITLEADKEYLIEFCTYMAASPTKGEVLGVSLMCSQSPDAVIKEIDVINDDSGAWKLNSYNYTPAETGTYYLGFHCMSPVLANATLIDDVKISEGPTSGFFGLAGVDVGVTDMLKGTVSAEYQVINKGTEPLELSFKSASPEISVSGLPLTVTYRKQGTFIVEFTPSKPGKYVGELVVATNDPAHPEVSLIVLADVLDVPVTSYAYEDFEAGGPKGWIFSTSAVNSDYYGGHNDSRAFYTRAVYCLSEEGPVGFTTHYVDLGDDPEFSFWYKLTDCDLMGVPSGPTADEIPVMQVLVSTDNGNTYTPVWELGQDSGRFHKQSDSFQQIRVPLKEYAGQRARVKFEIWGDVHPLEHDFIILVDDVALGTPHKVDLRAVNLTGTDHIVAATEGSATVYIENLGTESADNYTVQILDEEGSILGETTGTPLLPGEKKPVTAAWSLDRHGAAVLHALVVAPADEEPDNNSSNILAVDLLTPGNTPITIGSGNEGISSSFPLNFASRETASQTIYYANEIGTDRGTISSMCLTSMMPTNHLTESFEVFVKESDREDFDDHGWENPETFTKVFEGSVFLPAGRQEFVIPFSTPYAYNGKNIIVMMRKMSDVFIVNKPMLVHEADKLRTTFCSYLQRNQMINGGYADRQQVNSYAHAKFNIVKAPNGSVEGIVSDAKGTVAEAMVSVDGTQLYTFTDAHGHYSLPEVAEGDRSITVTKYGYYPSKANNLTIVAEAGTTRDIILSEYPRISLEGVVSDTEGQPLKDIRLYLEGYADYKAVTDDEGHYTISGIYGDTDTDYLLRTESSFYEPTHNKITLKSDTRHNIVLTDSQLRIHNLRTSESDGNLRLEWDAPIAEFKHDTGVPEDYMGWNHGHSECAIFTTYHKHILAKEIRWYSSNIYGPHANFNVFIFGLDKDGYPDPNNILYMARNVSFVDEAWNSHILPEPIEVEECAIGISCDGLLGLGRTAVDEDHPFTPLMHFFAGDSYKYELGISDFTSYMECHPMLRLGGDYLGDLDEKPRKSIVRPNCKYEVYRLTGNGWKERTLVGSTNGLSLDDLEYATLPDGTYRYAVTAAYPSGESEEVVSPVLSISHTGVDTLPATELSLSYDRISNGIRISEPALVDKVEVYSADGKVVMTTSAIEESISIQNLPEGLYIIRCIMQDNRIQSLKITK